MSYPNASYNYHPPAHSPNNPFYHDPLAPADTFSHPSAAEIPSQVGSTDAELLAEAQQHEQSHPPPPYESDNHEDALLDDSLSWIPAKNLPYQPQANHHPPLIRPVAIPQTSPGLTQLFSRAWAPILAEYGVRGEEFLGFIDHLNVCKSASPPLQVLSLAGTVLGFTPIPFAPLVGLGTSAAAGAATYATARVRITRYLERANKDYFVPRGSVVRIAKQNILPGIVGQSEDAPLLAPLPRHRDGNLDGGDGAGPTHLPSLRDRRLQALGSLIAPIEFHDLPPQQAEHNVLDRLSAKMAARKTRKQEEKIVEDSFKNEEDAAKEKKKLIKEEGKIRKEMEKVRRKEHGKKQREELEKLEKELEKERRKYGEKVGEGGGKEEKKARKFLWVVVMDLRAAGGGAAQGG